MAEILLGAVGTIAGVAGTIESIQNGEYWQAGFRGLTTFAIGAITISQAIRNWGRIQQGFSSIRNIFGNGNRGCVGAGNRENVSGQNNRSNSTRQNHIPDNESIIGHIFRDVEGHIPDTPENRSMLENVANSNDNFLGIDMYGNEWYSMNLDNGGQVWVESRNGHIFEGGVNDIPHSWNPLTGLKKP